jgi:hypothetical protein
MAAVRRQQSGRFNYIVGLKQHGINIRVTSNSWGGLRNAPPASTAECHRRGRRVHHQYVRGGNNGTNNDAAPVRFGQFHIGEHCVRRRI